MNRLSRWITAVLCAVVALPAMAIAQGAVITGKVTGDAGQPLEAATVYITELSIGVQTNTQGVYSLPIPPAVPDSIFRLKTAAYRATRNPLKWRHPRSCSEVGVERISRQHSSASPRLFRSFRVDLYADTPQPPAFGRAVMSAAAARGKEPSKVQ